MRVAFTGVTGIPYKPHPNFELPEFDTSCVSMGGYARRWKNPSQESLLAELDIAGISFYHGWKG